jgi:hypothetical protein
MAMTRMTRMFKLFVKLLLYLYVYNKIIFMYKIICLPFNVVEFSSLLKKKFTCSNESIAIFHLCN